MSEFLAEARVIIRPDTTRFRAELEAAIASATGKPVVVPVQAAFVGAGATEAAASAQGGLASATTAANEAQALQNVLVGRGAVLLETEAVAAAEDATAQQAVGAAKSGAAASTRALTSAQALGITAAQKLAFAQSSVAGAASEVTAAQVQLTRAQAAVVAGERALTAAISSKNAALAASTAETLAAARAYAVEAEAALFAARAQAEHAATLGSVGTAALANSASMLGLRGAVLTAGAAFLGATVAFQGVSKSIKAASDTAEELNKTTEVFGESSQQIVDFAETTATALGISNVEALRAAGIFGNLFRSINISTPAAAEMSEALVRLAADLASFNNADPSQVLDNLRSGLVGEPEPLRKFGIFLSQARAQQEALNATGKESVKQLTQQEIVQARFNIILRDSVLAQGDFARTSDSLANQTRILKAEVGDLGAQLGGVLVPALGVAVSAAADYAKLIGLAADATENLANKIPLIGSSAPGADSKLRSLGKSALELYGRLVLLGPVIGGATLAVDKLGIGADRTTTKINDLAHSFPGAGRAAKEMADDINELKDVLAALSGLEVEQLEIQTGLTAGGRAAEEANLRAQIEADKEAVEAAASGSAARRKALEELRRDQAALAALEKQDAQDAETAANAVKTAAEKAARARLEADRAFLELLSDRRSDQERRVARAAETEGLQDDIRAQNNLQALIKRQIAKVRERVTSEEERRAAIRELRIALIASRQEEEQLRDEQRKQAAATQQTALELDIDFAETTNNVNREIAARKRLIAFLKKQQREVKRGTLEWKRLRNEIAEQQQAIKEARDQAAENEGDGKSAQRFFFEQLQAQQGFAANLLGNLIPAGQTTGLVGVPAPSTPARVTQTSQAQAIAREGLGPTSGQANTQVDILRRILDELKRLNGSYDAPEAINQKKAGGAALDYAAM